MVFASQRTGSTWLSSYLLQQGIGVPFEYFNPLFLMSIGARLGCMLAETRIDIVSYIDRLQRLRSRHGLFGTKLQPDHLRMITVGDAAGALSMLRGFDKVVVLRRADRLRQAISLARARLTDQWQLYGDDRALGVPCDDDALFGEIDDALEKIQGDERYIAELAAGLRPEAVRAQWYEELSEPGVLEATADWIWAAVGDAAQRPVPDPTLDLPRKMEEAGLDQIEQRYLSARRDR